jgi:hypothetical protein
MEYISALNNSEILAYAKIWMDLKGIILHEIIHMEKRYWSYLTQWNHTVITFRDRKAQL